MNNDVMNIKEVATHLKLNEKAVYNLVQNKKIPFFKIGSNIRFSKEEVSKWILDSTQVDGLTKTIKSEPPVEGSIKSVFRKFTDSRSATRMVIMLRQCEQIAISNAILRRFNALNAKQVVLYLDDLNHRVAIEFVGNDCVDATRKLAKEASCVSLNIAGVLRTFGIKPLKDRYTLEYTEQEGMLVISLKEILALQK